METEFHFIEHPAEARIVELLTRLREKSETCGVLALIPEDLKNAVPMLQRNANSVDIPLIGALFPELIFGAQFRRDGILLLELDPMPDYRLLSPLSGEQHGWKSAVEVLCQMVESLPIGSSLLMIFDGLFGHIGSLLDDLYFELGDYCHYAGVNAGSETFQPMPCLFDRDNWLLDGVLGIALPHHPGAVLNHGYQVPQVAITASAAANNRITQINWQPAFEKYAELVQENYGVTVDRSNFYSMGVHFPFALLRGDGEMLIRIPVSLDDDGSLFCIGEIPEGALLNVAQAIMPGDTQSVANLIDKYRSLQASSGIFFYCAGRRLHLGEASMQELELLSVSIAPQPLIGALTLGEIGNSPEGGYPLFHNATLVALPLS